jgi:hypothetical protein
MPTLFNPIFIVGAPRSGTTLLQYMLRSHPDIYFPTGESHFIIPLYRNIENFGDLKKPENIRCVLKAMYKLSANFLDNDLHGIKFNIAQLTNELLAEEQDSISKIISTLFQKNANAQGKSRWGDKTPYYVLHMDKLLKMFPSAQFIHIIRDGRDCTLSMFERKNDFGVYNTFFAAKYWEIYVERGRCIGKELGDEIYHEIHYEDLLNTPEKILKEICTFLNEPYNDKILHYKRSEEAGKTPLLQKSLQIDNQAKWKTNMTTRQIRIFEGAVNRTLTEFGYPLITDAKPLSLPIKAFWRTHNQLMTFLNNNFKE